ncbi:MAG: hypothetical protein ABI622_00470 [Chloroflexota bacterium]
MNALLRSARSLLLLCLLATACGAPRATSSAGSDLPGRPDAAGVAAARADLDRYLKRLEAIHPEPFHGIDRGVFVAELDELKAALPTLSREQAMVELMRATALLSRAGRDGHQIALPLPEDGGMLLPMRAFEFADGLFVTASHPSAEPLVGARVTALNGHPIEEVLDALEPLVPRDSPATVANFRPVFMSRVDVLRGLGLLGAAATVPLTVEEDGAERTVSLEPITFDAYRDWSGDLGVFRLPSADDDPTFSVEELAASHTLYIRYSQVQRIPVEDLAAIRERAAAPDIERVVLDLRQNPGGDNHSYPPLLAALQAEGVDVPGRLYVLTDHTTFSAAANLASELERTTDAVFAGDPMGGGINFWDDVSFVRLDAWPIPMQVGVSTRYWQMGLPDDPRLTIEPDLAVPLTAADYFAGRDAVLEAVLAQ